MPRSNQLSPGAAHLIGLLFIASGAMPMLAAFDIGPLRAEDINGPPWLGLAAGGCFAAAGCAIIAGPQSPLAARLFGILALLGLVLVGNWVAFGAGERICGGSFSLSWIGGSRDLAGLACRIPFGVGALVIDAFLCLMLATTLQQALGGPPRLARLVSLAEWLILASLLPILLPMLPARVKEWAYFGLFVDLVAALISFWAIDDPVTVWAPMFLFIAVLLVAYQLHHKRLSLRATTPI